MQNPLVSHKGSSAQFSTDAARLRSVRQPMAASSPRPAPSSPPATKSAWRPEVAPAQATHGASGGIQSTYHTSARGSSIVAGASAGRWPANWRDGADGPGGPSSGGNPSSAAEQQAGALAVNDPKSSSLRKLVVDGAYESQIVQVKFCLKYRTSYGQTVKLLGSHPQLGAWDLKKAVPLQWSEGDRWVTTMDLPAGAVYEYKYVLVDHETQSPLAWQGGGNSILALQDEDNGVALEDNWGNTPGANLSINGAAMTRENKLQQWAKEMASYKATAKNASIIIARKDDELASAKAQIARLKMELSLSSKSKEEIEQRVVELQQENVLLKGQVAQSQMAMKSTLEEAIKLLAEEMEEEDDDSDSGAGGSGTEASASGSSSGFGFNWGRSNEPSHTYAHASTSDQQQQQQGQGQQPNVERFGIRMSAAAASFEGTVSESLSSMSGREGAQRLGEWASGWRSALQEQIEHTIHVRDQAQQTFATSNWRAMFS